VIPEGPYPEGPRLRFRPLVRKDAHGPYCEWINDPRVKRYLVARFERMRPADLERYIKTVNISPTDVMFAVCDRARGCHIGNVKLQNINPDHGTADLSVVIGHVARWRQGLGTEAIALMTAYAFKRLGLRRISAGSYTANQASMRAFLKCGYIKEGVSRGLYLLNGVAHDCMRVGILAGDPPLWETVVGRFGKRNGRTVGSLKPPRMRRVRVAPCSRRRLVRS